MTTAPTEREAIDEHFLTVVTGLAEQSGASPQQPLPEGTGPRLLELFDSQLGSRHLDFAARQLGARGLGFYSIGSSGHESNAAVAAALTPSDPALLHYRSGGFYLERARQLSGSDPLRDVLLGVVASADEPISAGRHKVFGNAALGVIPQTSTIASHLPRAVGLAFCLDRANGLGAEHEWSPDSVVVTSFGDASANHSTATGAINTALHCAYQGLSMPLLMVCEDNGIGISVRTPPGWIESAYAHRPGLRFFTADGDDPLRCLDVARQAAEWVRRHRAPALLHLRTVRLMGHAGSDVESGYRGRTEISADYDHDPVLATARALVRHGVLSPDEVVERYEAKRSEVTRIAEETGAITMVPFTYHWMPVNRWARQLVEEGWVGQPLHANLRYYTSFGFDTGYSWRFDKEIADLRAVRSDAPTAGVDEEERGHG